MDYAPALEGSDRRHLQIRASSCKFVYGGSTLGTKLLKELEFNEPACKLFVGNQSTREL